MPPCVDRPLADFTRVREAVGPSVVTVSTFEKRRFTTIFSTGFVIYKDEDLVLICVSDAVLQNEGQIHVHFHDESHRKARVLEKELTSGLIVIEVDAQESCQPVRFCTAPVQRDDIFIIAEAEATRGFNLMSGSIHNPNCRTVDLQKCPLGEHMFSFSCTAVGREFQNWKDHECQILDAGVFNWDAELLGTVQSLDEDSYDLKFALRCSQWIDELEMKLWTHNLKFSITRSA